MPAPDVLEIAGAGFEANRRRITSNVFIQLMQVVLCSLKPKNQPLRLGVVADRDRQHFEAGLTSLKRVAAFVRQTGHHFSDGRQPFRLYAFSLRFVELGHIEPDEQDRR